MGPVHPSVQNPGKNTEYNADIAKKRKGRDIVTEKKVLFSVCRFHSVTATPTRFQLGGFLAFLWMKNDSLTILASKLLAQVFMKMPTHFPGLNPSLITITKEL